MKDNSQQNDTGQLPLRISEAAHTTQLLPWVGYPRTLHALNALNEGAPASDANRSLEKKL
jgi:hypothetical protein